MICHRYSTLTGIIQPASHPPSCALHRASAAGAQGGLPRPRLHLLLILLDSCRAPAPARQPASTLTRAPRLTLTHTHTRAHTRRSDLPRVASSRLTCVHTPTAAKGRGRGRCGFRVRASVCAISTRRVARLSVGRHTLSLHASVGRERAARDPLQHDPAAVEQRLVGRSRAAGLAHSRHGAGCLPHEHAPRRRARVAFDLDR